MKPADPSWIQGMMAVTIALEGGLIIFLFQRIDRLTRRNKDLRTALRMAVGMIQTHKVTDKF